MSTSQSENDQLYVDSIPVSTKHNSKEFTNGSNEKSNINRDAFLASMTFANPESTFLLPNGRKRTGGCDCDECECLPRSTSIVSVIPETIRVAVQEYKRQKRQRDGIVRTQVRTLVRRDDDDNSTNVALWQWILPSGIVTDPIIEYGNSSICRLVWVQRLRGTATVLKSIGTGIIGSSTEEQNRQRLDWREGNVYLVPSYDTKAVGWIVEKERVNSDDRETETSAAIQLASSDTTRKNIGSLNNDDGGGPAVLYVAKVPTEKLQKRKDEGTVLDVAQRDTKCESSPDWFDAIVSICSRNIRRWNDTVAHDNMNDTSNLNIIDSESRMAVKCPPLNGPTYLELDNEDSILFQQIVSKLS